MLLPQAGAELLCATGVYGIVGSSDLMLWALQGEAARASPTHCLQARLSEGNVRLRWQLPGANTGCPSGLAHFNMVRKAAARHFCHPLKMNSSVTCIGVNSGAENLARSESSSFKIKLADITNSVMRTCVDIHKKNPKRHFLF